jgi:hypothetical protein
MDNVLFVGSARTSMTVSERDPAAPKPSEPARASYPISSAVAGCDGDAIGWRSFCAFLTPAECALIAFSVWCA